MGNRLKKKDWNYGHWEGGHYVSRGKRGYHSKYGGGTEWRENKEIEWYCQSCNQLQPSIMPSYKISFNDGESVRVCPMCKHISVVERLINITELMSLVRPFGGTIANLLSLPLRY